MGVSYDADLKLALQLMAAAASQHPRVLAKAEPTTRRISFGDSAINLEVRFWIKDPQHGVANVCSDIQLAIWEAFRENNITFPVPQRDVRLYPVAGPGLAVPRGEPLSAESDGSATSPPPVPPAAGPPPK